MEWHNETKVDDRSLKRIGVRWLIMLKRPTRRWFVPIGTSCLYASSIRMQLRIVSRRVSILCEHYEPSRNFLFSNLFNQPAAAWTRDRFPSILSCSLSCFKSAYISNEIFRFHGRLIQSRFRRFMQRQMRRSSIIFV